MAWNTIQDYINDPAGFEATCRRFKAATGGGDAGGRPVSQAFRFWEAEQACDPDRILALGAVADAARAVHDAARDHVPFDVMGLVLLQPGDALDVLDKFKSQMGSE